ncbi:hypothetical protein Tco_1149801 [Tanacetum coccineum]
MEMVASASGGDDDVDGLRLEAEIMVVARWRGAVDLAEARRKSFPATAAVGGGAGMEKGERERFLGFDVCFCGEKNEVIV